MVIEPGQKCIPWQCSGFFRVGYLHSGPVQRFGVFLHIVSLFCSCKSTIWLFAQQISCYRYLLQWANFKRVTRDWLLLSSKRKRHPKTLAKPNYGGKYQIQRGENWRHRRVKDRYSLIFLFIIGEIAERLIQKIF